MSHNLQALRAIAAYGVVGHHVVDSLRHHIAIGRFGFDPALGSTGVHVFFVISGYLMAATTVGRQQSPAVFLWRRIRRIVPLYWLLTAVTCMALAAGFQLFGNEALNGRQMLESFSFVPGLHAGGRASTPVLFVGWTLNYEMLFYAVFALCLLFRSERWRLGALSAVFGTFWLVHLVSSSAVADYLGRDLVLAFVFGALLAPLTRGLTGRAPVRASGRGRPWPAVAWALVAVGVLGLATIDLPAGWRPPGPELVLALAATLVVAGSLLLERTGVSVGAGGLSRHGDSSYSLYLIHPFVLQVVGKVAIATGVNRSAAGLVVVCAAMLVGSAVAARVLYRFVEAPIAHKKLHAVRLPISGSTPWGIVREL